VLRNTVGDFTVWPNVVVHASIDYRAEVPVGTREVLVETEVSAVGRTSVTFAQRVKLPDGTLAAEAEAVLVAWDREARGSRQVSAADRAALVGPDG